MGLGIYDVIKERVLFSTVITAFYRFMKFPCLDRTNIYIIIKEWFHFPNINS